MARTVFLILVSINVALFAWGYLNAERHEMAGREPQRIAMQLQPEKIRIVDPRANEMTACRAYTGAAPADAQELVKTWGVQFPAVTFSVVPVPSPATFEAIIAGFNTRAAAAARLNELRTLGIDESFVVRAEEGGKFSLVASFADHFGAEAKQRAAAQKGVVGVSIAERPSPTANAIIQARGPTSALASLATQAAAKNLTATSCP